MVKSKRCHKTSFLHPRASGKVSVSRSTTPETGGFLLQLSVILSLEKCGITPSLKRPSTSSDVRSCQQLPRCEQEMVLCVSLLGERIKKKRARYLNQTAGSSAAQKVAGWQPREIGLTISAIQTGSGRPFDIVSVVRKFVARPLQNKQYPSP